MRRPWEKHKAEMIRLYLDERMKLDDVMEVMLRDFNFKASKRAYRFHFDHWGIEKYNCKKRNQRKKLQLPSPPATSSSPTHSVSAPSLGVKDEQCGGLDLEQDGGECFPDAFAVRSLSRSTGLAFSSTSLSYPGNLALSPMQALMPSPSRMLPRPPPTPEGDASPANDQIFMEPNQQLLGPDSSYFRAPAGSLLHEAIRRGDASQLRAFVEQGCRLDMADSNDSFPIHAAVANGDPAIVRMLLQAGGDPSQPDGHGRSPLYQATTLTTLNALLAWSPPPDLCQKDYSGDTILHHLVRSPWWWLDLFKREAVYRILEQRTYGAAPVNTADAQGMTPFHVALVQTETSLPALITPLTRMLSRNADVATPMPAPRFESPKMPLEVLVQGMQAYLQTSRAEQNALDERQWDSLHVLFLRFLDLSAPNSYPVRLLRVFLTPMMLRVSICRLWKFLQRLVVESVADMSVADEQGRTALHDVLLSGSALAQGGGHGASEEKVTMLLKMLVGRTGGETLRAGDESGQAAWQIYVRRWGGHRRFGEMMRLFADHGAGMPEQPRVHAPRPATAPKGTAWDPFLEGQAMR